MNTTEYITELQREQKSLRNLLASCLKLVVEVKQFTKTIKVPCQICEHDTLIEDTYDCEKCGKSVCADCIVGVRCDEDDYLNVCTDCTERGE
jgi:hypothetical protein